MQLPQQFYHSERFRIQLLAMIVIIVLINFMLMNNVINGNNYPSRNITFHKYGPNVCEVDGNIPSTGNDIISAFRYQSWLPQDNRQQHTCGKNTIVRHECCEGFKSMFGHLGCTGVKSPKNVLETAQELGACEFIRYVRQNGLYETLTTGGPYTIFVPTDEAFARMDSGLKSHLQVYESATEILKYHVVPRRIITQNMSSDETLDTLNKGLKLRFNKYYTKIETINCIGITRKNRVAQNGVVHLINTVLSPYSYSNRNLVQIINQNTELTIFSKMLDVSRLHQSLKETFQTLTVLAPTDNALQRFPHNQLQRILDDETRSKAFVLKHLLPTLVCPSAITQEHYVKSLADKHYAKFSCDGTNSVMVQGKCIGNNLKFSSNGIIYAIHFAISTEEGKSIMQIMQRPELSNFFQIINVAGLAQTFENFNTFTVFAPSNEAIKRIDPVELYHIQSNPSAARAFVDIHVAKEIITADTIYDGKVVESLAYGKPLRFQCIQNDYGIEGHPLNFQTPVGFNGAVHILDRVMCPPTMSVEDFTRKNDSFSLYVRATRMLQQLQWTNYDDDVSSSTHRTHTYFIPTDRAFRKLGAVTLQQLFENPSYMRMVMDNHRANRIVPASLIRRHRSWQYDVQTKNTVVQVTSSLGQRNEGDSKLMANNAEIIETDIMTTDGLVHIIDDLVYHPNLKDRRLIELTDF